jgi:hypothetical protein
MPITDETRRRLMSFKEKIVAAEVLKADADSGGIIHITTWNAYCAKVAHALGKDSHEIGESNVRTLAHDLGYTIRATTGMSLMSTTSRVTALESAFADMTAQVQRLTARVDELDRIYLEAGSPTSVVPVPETGALGHNARRNDSGKRV